MSKENGMQNQITRSSDLLEQKCIIESLDENAIEYNGDNVSDKTVGLNTNTTSENNDKETVDGECTELALETTFQIEDHKKKKSNVEKSNNSKLLLLGNNCTM